MPAKTSYQPRPPSHPRRSLRQSLREVFSFGRSKKGSSLSTQPVGSGILRRGEPPARSYRPQLSQSPFPEFSNSHLSLPAYPEPLPIPNRFQTPPRASSVRASDRQSLLPARSLSQFNLSHDYFQRSNVPRGQISQIVSPTFTSIVSHEASVTSSASLTTYPSVSTLRVQDSRARLAHTDGSIFHHFPSRDRPHASVPVQKHVSWLQSPSCSTVNRTDSGLAHEVDEDGLNVLDGPLVEHFRSFCILDTNVPGYPVIATSQELRYIFNIGEHFFLNSSECEGSSMDIVTGRDAAGNPITHLVLFTPLVIPSSGRSRFMLASLIDVTRFINDAASLPELEKASNDSSIESDPRSPLPGPIQAAWNETGYKLSSEDLLGGCVLPQDRRKPSKPQYDRDDIWLNLANEEGSTTTTIRSTPQPAPKRIRTPGSSNASHASVASSSVDEVLEEFMSGLQELYSDFFLLGKSPLDDTYYEICNVSPMLYAAKDYIHGHLSHTGPEGIAELSVRLARECPFDLQVRWGDGGHPKRLYCSPLYGQNSTTWICFLVGLEIPLLW